MLHMVVEKLVSRARVTVQQSDTHTHLCMEPHGRSSDVFSISLTWEEARTVGNALLAAAESQRMHVEEEMRRR